MFLNMLEKRNKNLLNTAFELHQKGYIMPDSYLIDVDMFLENAKKILKKAKENNIKLYYMLKQIGRNPYLAQKLEEMGYDGAVVVDFKEAEIMIKNNLKIGHIGHLVQIPKNMLEKIINYNTEIITIYSLEIAEEISKKAIKNNKIQNIMIKIIDKNSHIYKGQESGFFIENIERVIERLLKLKGIKIAGITSFPCFLYNKNTNKIENTENVYTILKLKEILEKKYNLTNLQINLPSVTSVENIELIKKYNGTHGEPGHSLTGTTPLGENNEIEEIPAYVYVSEISHNFNNKSYFYGGGYYRRGNLKKAIVGNNIKNYEKINVDFFDNESIDYYLQLEKENEIGDTVLTSFRTQMFVTRSDIILVEGISQNNPKIIGKYSTLGEKITME